MNIVNFVNIGGPLERDALRILQDIPGVAVDPKMLTEGRPDILIRAGDVTHVVELKVQRITNAAAARQLVEYKRELPKGTRLLLVTRTTTEEARLLLQDAGIGVIDGAGNMRVDFKGLFVWSEGRRDPHRAQTVPGLPPVKLTGKAGLAALALLQAPERRWHVQDLAEEASVSVGLAHRVLARLERERLVETDGAGPQRNRRVTDPAALLDLWADEMRDRGVRQLRAFRLSRDPRAQTRTLSRAMEEANIEHAVTGAAGAARLAPFVTAVPVIDIWVGETVELDAVAAATQAEAVTEGHNIVLRQAPMDAPLAFRQKVDGVWTVNPFRLFYDLRQNPQRGREQADRLRQEVIGF